MWIMQELLVSAGILSTEISEVPMVLLLTQDNFIGTLNKSL
jgi:hypothetical protein